MNVVECKGITKQYGQITALDNLTFSIQENKITGLIGRNGAGKTTLLKIISGFMKEKSGEVRVFSEHPFNSLKVSTNSIFIDDQMDMPTSLTLIEILETAQLFYPNWDMVLAKRLFDYFSFHSHQRHSSLSKGKKSTFNMIIGLASRCALTIYDEPTTGMDASVRKDFYRALLKDYLAYPRTIILSSHLLNEMEDLLEEVLLIKDGQKHLQLSISALKEYAIALEGPRELVETFVRNKAIFFTKQLAPTRSYFVIRNDLKGEDIQKLRLQGIECSSVSTDDLCIYLTNQTKGGIDDVFK
ncbi:ATP-binding cassette domain-containing protein [Bacillus solitudinis]|uniref:ATP-binding cassette domain-containing protein n=1 Tax=Bacillus solitudinis TaxID=2014074 RepID=UPI000C242A36|nr:ABC transporter ATP-binding protein [Bacillus solitudinis]